MGVLVCCSVSRVLDPAEQLGLNLVEANLHDTGVSSVDANVAEASSDARHRNGFNVSLTRQRVDFCTGAIRYADLDLGGRENGRIELSSFGRDRIEFIWAGKSPGRKKSAAKSL